MSKIESRATPCKSTISSIVHIRIRADNPVQSISWDHEWSELYTDRPI